MEFSLFWCFVPHLIVVLVVIVKTLGISLICISYSKLFIINIHPCNQLVLVGALKLQLRLWLVSHSIIKKLLFLVLQIYINSWFIWVSMNFHAMIQPVRFWWWELNLLEKNEFLFNFILPSLFTSLRLSASQMSKHIHNWKKIHVRKWNHVISVNEMCCSVVVYSVMWESLCYVQENISFTLVISRKDRIYWQVSEWYLSTLLQIYLQVFSIQS